VREEPLSGGRNTSEVVRAGDTVRRARDPGSAFAARLPGSLESAGYPYAPRFLGVDDRGRDILTYVPGRTTDHPSQRADGAYARGASMLRELHDLTAGHPLAGGRECVLHGDPGPFNTIFSGGTPVAFVDWTSSRPGGRLDDLGHMAWTWCIQSEGNVPPGAQAAHLRELRDAYGPVPPQALIDAMIRSQDRILLHSGQASRTPVRGPSGTRAGGRRGTPLPARDGRWKREDQLCDQPRLGPQLLLPRAPPAGAARAVRAGA
jgi:hypothetical protein